MGKKSKKRIIRRVTPNEKEMGKGVIVCKVCYPDRVAKMPYTIYMKKFIVEEGNSKVKIMIAWCAECMRWLAEKETYFGVRETIDIAHELSDGKNGKGLMSWERWCALGRRW